MPRITRTAIKAGMAVAMAVAACAAFSTSASAATGADGFTIIHASDGAAVHQCHILGTDDDYHEAIVCVDINTMTYDGYAYAQGEVEAYCQDDNGTPVQCANITVEGEASDATGTSVEYYKYCGHQYGACPTGRLYDYLSTDWIVTSAEGDSTCGQVPDSDANFWSIANGYYTTIELPGSDDTYTVADTVANDGSNLSTGHYYVCW